MENYERTNDRLQLVIRLLSLIAVVLMSSACVSGYQKRGIENPIPWEDAFFLSDLESRQKEPYDEQEKKVRRRLDVEARSVERFLVESDKDKDRAESKFSLGVVEISDEGTFNPAQYEQVFRALRCEVTLQSTEEKRTQLDKTDQCESFYKGYPSQPQSNGTLLVVFVHGWHHSCRTCDRDIACFRSALSELAKAEAKQKTGRRVFGVYVGWRGRAISGVGDYLSIWNRKATAEHIGRTAGKELLNDLHALWAQGDDNFTMVTVGHSLGGAFLLSAARGHLTGNAADILAGEEGDYRVVRSESRHVSETAGQKAKRGHFGDLLVLLNPAIEAEEWDPFDKDLYDRQLEAELSKAGSEEKMKELVERRLPFDKTAKYNDKQLPVMIAIASTADSANGIYFPISRWLGAVNPFNGDSLIKKREREAIGHYDPYVTHTLSLKDSIRNGDPEYDMRSCACPDNAKGWKSASSKDAAASLPYMSAEELLSVGRTPPGSDPRAIFSVKEHRESGLKGDWKLELVPERRCFRGEKIDAANDKCTRGWDINSPYIVVQADKTVIGAHSDVFNPIVVGFLTDYLGTYYSYTSKNIQRSR